MSNWHQLETSNVLTQLQTDSTSGLSEREVVKRRAEQGTNELLEFGGRGPLRILWDQFYSALVLMLVIAACVSAYLGEFTDTIVILIIVALNAALGFYQEFRAERAMAALKRLAVPTVKTRRGGKVIEISSRELVAGDIVLLEAGNLVPADCRLIECHSLQIEEAALTGESEAIEKTTRPVSEDRLALGDRRNMAYMGTIATYGHAEAVVTEIGMRTELGQIARMLQTVQPQATPLQKRLAQLGRALAVAAIAIVAVVFVMGLLRGEEIRLMLMTAMSLAVAAVPEGLPAVATVALAVGASRMLQRNGLIRKLPAVETLGSVTVICSDKTGTLTQNRMTVTALDVAGETFDLPSVEIKPSLSFTDDGSGRDSTNRPALALLTMGGCLCNDALLQVEESADADQPRALGEPTEAALMVAAARVGIIKPELEPLFPRISEMPFDSERKRMTTLHEVSLSTSPQVGMAAEIVAALSELTAHRFLAVTKGATGSLLTHSRQIWVENRIEPLSETWRERISVAHDEMAGRGMRVLALAVRGFDEPLASHQTEAIEEDLIFVGMFGIIDPPRAEAKESVARCRSAGIMAVMITGDHALTARHIARELGIGDDGRTLTGHELTEMSQEDLEQAVEEVSVYARVSPEHKLRIVTALQSGGHVVSMTGDGVNDAPALKKADIGVAMGVTGTDVAKEASEMVLLDDNFATIVNAVEEGRVIYDNIRKFVRYTLTSNAGEIWVMLLAPLVGMPLPLLPLQILWVNLVTDGLPGLALGLEPAERDVMKRPPRSPSETILDRGMSLDILWVGLLMGLISLGVGYWYWLPAHDDDRYWRTVVFTVLTISQMGNALAIRSENDSLFQIGVFSNLRLLGAVLLTLALQLGVIYLPALQEIFKTTALSIADLSLCLIFSTAIFCAFELKKWQFRQRNAARSSHRQS